MASSGNADTGASTFLPTQKVFAGGVAGALSTVVVFVLNNYILTGKTQISPEIAAALTTLLSFVFAYFVPPNSKERVVG